MMSSVTALLEQALPVLIFLVSITVVAEIAELAGVFALAGHWAARAAGGRTVLLWLLVVVLATGCTIVLSLDTTAVLLTPVVIAVARRTGVDPVPLAMTTLWLANTASLLLPVSNLSNLLALHHFSQFAGHRSYLSVAWRPALAAIVVTVLLLALLHHRRLRGRYSPAPEEPCADRPLRAMVAVVCVLLGPVFVVGVMPAVAATGAALLLLALLAVRDRQALRRIRVPWRMVLAITALFAVVRWLGGLFLDRWLAAAVGSGNGVLDHLRIAGIGTGGANLINNLPAYLALEPAAADSPERLLALLVGVNVGPLVVLWASLATLLWRDRCVRLGVRIPLTTLAWQGALLAGLAVPVAALVI